jgi:predicted DNA-binding protein (MmcQ/YjbR family)
MGPDELREFCLSLPQAIEVYPFGEETCVFKTSGNLKVFGVTHLDGDPLAITLKCDPEESLALREAYPQITPGYHMNKKHWITVLVNAGLPDDLVEQLIHDSHALVRPRMPRGR